jgi:hypothetical protein
MSKLAEFLEFGWVGIHSRMITEIVAPRKKPLVRQRLFYG